ncbi:interleukin-34 isoform X1 [Melanerpes formicivorus]|uniref:interleukin-34 isoform X1 n=1 Tax=Melanerpes formicivorus TaxID=211600 RepID=UPI0035900D92
MRGGRSVPAPRPAPGGRPARSPPLPPPPARLPGSAGPAPAAAAACGETASRARRHAPRQGTAAWGYRRAAQHRGPLPVPPPRRPPKPRAAPEAPGEPWPCSRPAEATLNMQPGYAAVLCVVAVLGLEAAAPGECELSRLLRDKLQYEMRLRYLKHYFPIGYTLQVQYEEVLRPANITRLLAGRAAGPRGAAGAASLLEVRPGAGLALRGPGRGVQQVPADRCGGGGGRAGEGGAQRGRGEPEEGRAPQGAAGQLPQGHEDALRGTLSVGVHLTPQTIPHEMPSPWSLGCCLCSVLPTRRPPWWGWERGPVGRWKSGDKCHPPLGAFATPSGTSCQPIRDLAPAPAGPSATLPGTKCHPPWDQMPPSLGLWDCSWPWSWPHP